MHVAFIPYGKIEEVELLLRDMRAQKHYLKMQKGKKEVKIPIESQIRVLPFGVYEYVFPKEDADRVLNSLKFDRNNYKIPKLYLKLIRKFLRLKAIPKFEAKEKYLWITQNVGIIPLGVRYDAEMIEPEGRLYSGYTHEAI